MSIDFTLSDSQRELQHNARAFADEFLRPATETIDQSTDPWEAFLACREAFAAFAKFGFTKSFIPAADGGSGVPLVDLAIAVEELSRVDVNVPTALLANGLALHPLIALGTAEQRERFVRPFAQDAEGDLLAAFAFTDLAGGANFDTADPNGGIETIARRDGAEWVISGQKHYTTNGTGWDKTGCHQYTLMCRTDPGLPADEALALIVVPGDTPGITVVDVYDKVGHRGVVTPLIRFDNVRVPLENLVGEVGSAAKAAFTKAFSWTACLIGAASVGAMRAAFDYALAFTKSELRLGTVPVIEHQNVGFMLADVKMSIEACRYLTWKACHEYERTDGESQELAIMAKVYCSEAAVTAVWNCMRIVGIASYTKNLAPLERIMRDTMAFPLYDGGNLGIRRRQLHDLLRDPSYDSLGAAYGSLPVLADGEA